MVHVSCALQFGTGEVDCRYPNPTTRAEWRIRRNHSAFGTCLGRFAGRYGVEGGGGQSGQLLWEPWVNEDIVEGLAQGLRCLGLKTKA